MLNGSQTFVLDKEALESCESTCMLFVFSQSAPTHCPTVVKYTSVVKHCEQCLQSAVLSVQRLSLCVYAHYIVDMPAAPSCGCHATVAFTDPLPIFSYEGCIHWFIE